MSFSAPTLDLGLAMTGLGTTLLRFEIILFILTIGAAMWILWPIVIGAGWIPTPKSVVKKMLDFAGVGPSDTLIDLGSGDGRIILMAAEYGARAVGIEADSLRVLITRIRIRLKGLDDRVDARAHSRAKEDVNAKDFAEKKGMNLQSVSSMLKQARSNATLYEEMLAAGYRDGEFPAWWFSPALEAELRQTPAQRTLTEAEGAEEAELGRDTQGAEAYDPTPPRTPAPREAGLGRPALAPASAPSAAEPPSAALSHAQPAPATFTDAELSLLKERSITEVTPGRWMRMQEQAVLVGGNDTI